MAYTKTVRRKKAGGAKANVEFGQDTMKKKHDKARKEMEAKLKETTKKKVKRKKKRS